MKTLLLVRHAKAGWSEGGMPDHQRPLTARGREDAAAMGRRLREWAVRPDAVITSSAVRARTTAGMIATALALDPGRIRSTEALYGATGAELLAAVTALDDRLDCVILVGHNPGLTDLAHRFSAAITHLPTCAVAGFRFPVRGWAELAGQHGTAFLFSHPAGGKD